jgi:hypothetical protein
VARKLVFNAPFYSAYKAPPICLLSCYTMGLQSWRSPLHTTYILSHDLPLSPYLLPYTVEKREIEKQI